MESSSSGSVAPTSVAGCVHPVVSAAVSSTSAERGITHVRVQPKGPSNLAWRRATSRGVDHAKKAVPATTEWLWTLKQCVWVVLLVCVVVYILMGEHLATFGLPTCMAATATMTSTTTTIEAAASTTVYVSMVSIPVLERVLPMKYLAEELLHRGYRVSFALPEICRSWVSDVPGLEFISLGTMPISAPSYTLKSAVGNVGIYTSYWHTLQQYAAFQKPMFHPLLEDFLEDPPTLAVVDRYTFAGMDACNAVGIPFVVNNPFLLLDVDDPPSYVPAPLSQHPMETQTVYERCANGLYRLRFRLLNLALSLGLHKSTDHAIYGERVVLTNTAFGLEYSRPLAPLYPMVGAMRRRHVTPVMDAGLESWFQIAPLELEADAIVLVDFGPDVDMPADAMVQIIQVLRDLSCRVIWKLTPDMHKMLKAEDAHPLHEFESWGVYLSPLIAHTAVFPHVRFFLTSGGVFFSQEALCAGRPILAIPFSAEHVEFTDRIVRAGAGVSIQVSQLTMESFRWAAQLLLTHDRYTSLFGCHDLAVLCSFVKAATRLGGLLDSAGGTVHAADAVLDVVHRGTAPLVPARQTQPFFKTYLLDVYAVYGAVLCGVAVILRTLLSACVSVFQRKQQQQQTASEHLHHHHSKLD
ncbi:unnamed protein product [Aphanomyces euteiches]